MNNYFDSKIIGTCKEMCPKSEILRREKQSLLHKYEVETQAVVASKSRLKKADHKKCVKEFTRAAAGQALSKACDLRPPEVLLKTVNYLLNEILMLQNESWIDRYNFIFDRFRSIRQDMTIQNVFDHNCVTVMEDIVRFYIYSLFQSCDLPVDAFDPHINETHLRECLKKLVVYYNEVDLNSPNRFEIEAYYILLHLGSNEALNFCVTLLSSARPNFLCQKAICISQSWFLRNYYRVFRLIKTLPFLCCAVLLPHIESIRRYALLIMNTGYSIKNSKYPLKRLTSLLLFDDVNDTVSTCKYYGLKVDSDYVYFSKPNFLTDRPLLKMRRYQFINGKMDQSYIPRLMFENTSLN